MDIKWQTDLIGRLRLLIQNLGFTGVIVVIAALFVAFLLLYIRKFRPLILGLWISLMFSGAFGPGVDSFSTLIRWTLIVLLALGTITRIRIQRLPKPLLLIGLFAVIGMFSSPFSPNPIWAIQFSLMLGITTIGMGSLIYREFLKRSGITNLMYIIEKGAIVYLVLAISGLFNFRGGMRFTGIWISAPLFVITGGLMLPMLLWMATDPARPLLKRLRSGILFGVIAVLCVFSGERTGTLAGLIGSIVIIFRFKKRRNIIAFTSIILILLGILSYMSRYNRQWEFVRYRYFEKGLSGRPERWQKALQLCTNEPILPHGMGSANTFDFGFHNAYLVAWYEGGLLGLLLFLSAIVLTLFRGLKAMFSKEDEMRKIGTLIVSVMITLILTGFAESKFMSPSNIEIVLFVFIAAMSELLNNPIEIVRNSLNYEGGGKSWIKRFLLRAVYH